MCVRELYYVCVKELYYICVRELYYICVGKKKRFVLLYFSICATHLCGRCCCLHFLQVQQTVQLINQSGWQPISSSTEISINDHQRLRGVRARGQIPGLYSGVSYFRKTVGRYMCEVDVMMWWICAKREEKQYWDRGFIEGESTLTGVSSELSHVWMDDMTSC